MRINESIEILERTPAALGALLRGISDEWTSVNEGGETWTVFDVIGHLAHGEKTDWMARLSIILSDEPDKTFPPFDRFAQFNDSKGKSLEMLLDDFKTLRAANIEKLRSLNLSENDRQKNGVHPALGTVSLENLLATWVVHDLDHISQISRVMAKRNTANVGPWFEYLKILKQ